MLSTTNICELVCLNFSADLQAWLKVTGGLHSGPRLVGFFNFNFYFFQSGKKSFLILFLPKPLTIQELQLKDA